MRLDHHYTLKLTCDRPGIAMGSTQVPVMTISGDYQTVSAALGSRRDVLNQLERFEDTLNDDDPEVTG